MQIQVEIVETTRVDKWNLKHHVFAASINKWLVGMQQHECALPTTCSVSEHVRTIYAAQTLLFACVRDDWPRQVRQGRSFEDRRNWPRTSTNVLLVKPAAGVLVSFVAMMAAPLAVLRRR